MIVLFFIFFLFSSHFVWGFPYYVQVDGRLVPPYQLPSLDWSSFGTGLNTTNQNGGQYHVVSGVSTMDTTQLLTLYLQHKLSTSHYHHLQQVLVLAWKRQHPGMHWFTFIIGFIDYIAFSLTIIYICDQTDLEMLELNFSFYHLAAIRIEPKTLNSWVSDRHSPISAVSALKVLFWLIVMCVVPLLFKWLC